MLPGRSEAVDETVVQALRERLAALRAVSPAILIQIPKTCRAFLRSTGQSLPESADVEIDYLHLASILATRLKLPVLAPQAPNRCARSRASWLKQGRPPENDGLPHHRDAAILPF
jgi:hypothetical protein